MTEARQDWAAAVADAGVDIPTDPTPEASARVSHAVESLAANRGFTDAALLLTLRLAASGGAAHDRLAEVDAWYRERRTAASTARPSYPPRSLPVAVLSFIFAVVGPILAFPSVRTSSDYFLNLEPAAVASGILATVSAIWFLVAEAVRIPFAGTRTRLYGPAVFIVPFGLVVAAIVTTLIRVNDEGSVSGAVPVGIALQFVAAALYVVAFLLAIRNRAAVRSAPAVVSTTAPSLSDDDVEYALRSRMGDALAGATTAELDRAAAAEGVRALFELGALSPKRARRALRALLP